MEDEAAKELFLILERIEELLSDSYGTVSNEKLIELCKQRHDHIESIDLLCKKEEEE